MRGLIWALAIAALAAAAVAVLIAARRGAVDCQLDAELAAALDRGGIADLGRAQALGRRLVLGAGGGRAEAAALAFADARLAVDYGLPTVPEAEEILARFKLPDDRRDGVATMAASARALLAARAGDCERRRASPAWPPPPTPGRRIPSMRSAVPGPSAGDLVGRRARLRCRHRRRPRLFARARRPRRGAVRRRTNGRRPHRPRVRARGVAERPRRPTPPRRSLAHPTHAGRLRQRPLAAAGHRSPLHAASSGARPTPRRQDRGAPDRRARQPNRIRRAPPARAHRPPSRSPRRHRPSGHPPGPRPTPRLPTRPPWPGPPPASPWGAAAPPPCRPPRPSIPKPPPGRPRRPAQRLTPRSSPHRRRRPHLPLPLRPPRPAPHLRPLCRLPGRHRRPTTRRSPHRRPPLRPRPLLARRRLPRRRRIHRHPPQPKTAPAPRGLHPPPPRKPPLHQPALTLSHPLPSRADAPLHPLPRDAPARGGCRPARSSAAPTSPVEHLRARPRGLFEHGPTPLPSPPRRAYGSAAASSSSVASSVAAPFPPARRARARARRPRRPGVLARSRSRSELVAHVDVHEPRHRVVADPPHAHRRRQIAHHERRHPGDADVGRHAARVVAERRQREHRRAEARDQHDLLARPLRDPVEQVDEPRVDRRLGVVRRQRMRWRSCR